MASSNSRGFEVWRHPEVQRQTGRSRSSLYNDMDAGLFPRPFRLGARSVGWPSHEVDTIIIARIAGKTDAEIIYRLCQGSF